MEQGRTDVAKMASDGPLKSMCRLLLLIAGLGLAACTPTQAVPGVAVAGPPPTPTATRRPTATPGWWVELTPGASTPTPTPTPTPGPSSAPGPSPTPTLDFRQRIGGQIVFKTTRNGGWEELWIMQPDGSDQRRLKVPGDDFFESGAQTIYDQALARQQLSPGQTKRAFVSHSLHDDTPVIYVIDYEYSNKTWDCTKFGAGIAYDPAWSPTDDVIAFVSNDSANDEIWTIRQGPGHVCHSARQLTHNTWEWDKFPTWSPDGTQIAFWSNRDGGHAQIFVMNADGSNQHNISNNLFDDYEPVWLRITPTPTPEP